MLGNRLKALLEFIDENDQIADIGCDHGYLLIAAVKKGVKFVQGIENKIGPLEQAKFNLSPYLSLEVKLSLSDGLDALDEHIDSIVISGMGGLNIINILAKNIEKAQQFKKMIIQPNSNIFELRKFLNENGFLITHEQIVFEKKQYYEILIAKYIGDVIRLSDNDLLFGPILRKEKSLLFIKKWTRVLNHLQKAYHPDQRQEELISKIELIKGELGGKE